VRRGGLLILLSMVMNVAIAPAGRSEETALIHGITHGREITKSAVGPLAGGYKFDDSTPAFEGGEIKAGATPSYARLVTEAASYDGLSVLGPHLLIENVTIQTPLDIYTPLPVVLRGVYVHVLKGGHWAIHTRPGSGPLYVLWSRIGGSYWFDGPTFEVQTGLLLRGGPAHIYRSHITLASDGIHADAAHITIVENLIDGLVAREDSHNDAIQTAPQARGIVIERNRIHNVNPQTSCIYNSASDVTVRDNYLAGGGWVMYGGGKDNGHGADSARNVSVTGNIFGLDHFAKSGNFGPVAYWDRANVWSRNRFPDGRTIAP
jgi:Right handed beta helix region